MKLEQNSRTDIHIPGNKILVEPSFFFPFGPKLILDVPTTLVNTSIATELFQLYTWELKCGQENCFSISKKNVSKTSFKLHYFFLFVSNGTYMFE